MTGKPREIDFSHDAERLLRLMSSLTLQNAVIGFFRALFFWISISLSGLACLIILEFYYHPDSWLRAVCLMAWLASSFLSFKFLFKPINRYSFNPTQLALKMEGIDPALKDSLASAIYFLEHGKNIEGASKEFVRESVSQAFDKVMLNGVYSKVKARGLGVSFLLSSVVLVFSLFLLISNAPFSTTALMRVMFPYENIAWPTLTQIEFSKLKQKVGKNEVFKLSANIKGQIPKQATILITCEGASHSKLLADIYDTWDESGCNLNGKIEVSTIGKNFELQLLAGDAVSEVIQVKVLPPPEFIDFAGSQSPVIMCLPPFYTGLVSPMKISPGTFNLEVPLGTTVQINGLADRPLKNARLELQSENKDLFSAAACSLFLSENGFETVAARVALESLNIQNFFQLNKTKEEFNLSFVPYVSGIYALTIEDENDLYAVKNIDVQIKADPAPLVKIESAIAKNGFVQLFPEAEIKLNLKAEDAFYGLKAVGVELKGAQKSALNTYDFWSRNLLDKNGKLSPAVNNEALDYVVKLKDYKNTLGGVLKAGDKFSLRFVANDHDDVLPLKLKGASDWLEIQVVDRNAIELVLEKAQEKARQELLRAREGQKKATKNAEFALKEIKSGETNLQKSLEAVASAEIEQKNVLEKLGEKESGLLGDLDKIKSLAEANKLKASASLNRLNDLAKEIKQLKDGAGALVEQNLSDASKRLESADSGKELDKEKLAKSLDNSIKNQNEIEKIMDGLLKNLEPWAGLTEMRSDARAALLELEEVKRKLEESTKLDPSSIGKKLDELSNQQKEKLQNLSNQQNKGAQKAQNLLDKMNKLAGENKKQDEALAKNINDALELPDVKQLNENLNAAKKETDANRLIEASKLQSKAVDAVKEILDKLEENPGEVNQKLVKKLREAEKQLQELKDEMQRLKKKRIEAQMMKDAQQKKAALAKNSSDTEKLASKMEEMAQNLSRIKNENNSENLDDSARELRRATANPMGDDDGKAFQQAVEKLQREIQDVQQLARETEEKLQRERLEKVAENLKLIQDRQVALILESERFDLLLKDKGAWTRAQILSLTGFSRAQIGLADETELVASRELDNLPVFMKTIGMAGRSMRNAAKLAERNARTQTKGPPLIEKVIPAQKEALVRLQQFQEALKEEMSQIGAVAKDNNPENKDKDSEGQKPEQPPEQSSSAGGPPDRKPASIAQLKLLRNLQSELYERTGTIASRFPEAKGMPEEARRELLQLQKDQREIGELLELLLEFNRQSQPKGEMQ